MTQPIDLQTAIDQAALILGAAKTPVERHEAWQTLQALIKSRPKEEVRRMDQERGLTR